MARDLPIKAVYRMAEKSTKQDNSILDKSKPEYINNANCFNNFKRHFTGDIHVVGDSLSESEKLVKGPSVKYIKGSWGSNSGSLLACFEYALDTFSEDDIIYFVEDDYLHREGVSQAILEGLERVDYVTLYDHPDKQMQWVQTFSTENYLWKLVQSTTFTFAVKQRTLALDWTVIKSSIRGKVPNDHGLFTRLNRNKLRLASVMPGLSTHGETQWLSPSVNWSKYV